jgi:hypothetical protein
MLEASFRAFVGSIVYDQSDACPGCRLAALSMLVLKWIQIYKRKKLLVSGPCHSYFCPLLQASSLTGA